MSSPGSVPLPTCPKPGSTGPTQVLDARGKIVLPGFVNTHHHFYQTLTRVIPAAQDVVLFDWLKTLYPIWAELTPDDVFVSTQLALTELLLSGCTTSSDHHYLWPNGSRLDDQFAAAETIGVRFHGARGSMSLGESQGGLPPDRVTEDEAAILRDCRRVVETYHDPSPYAMRRVVLAPCSPFSVTSGPHARERRAGPQLRAGHERPSPHPSGRDQGRRGILPGALRLPARRLCRVPGLDGRRRLARPLRPPEPGRRCSRFGQTHTGVAHCPTSNMRLASGIAPVRAMRDAGVPVGLGVDGSASNDGSHLLNEVRQCLLLQRVLGDPRAMTAREALEIATLGGAAVLGRDDIGALAPGMAADIVAFDLNSLWHSGGRRARSRGCPGLLPAPGGGFCPGERPAAGGGGEAGAHRFA